MNTQTQESLKNHAEKYGLTLDQFRMMCKGASETYEGQGMISTDYALAREAYFAGFTKACKEAIAQPAQEPVACHCGNPTFTIQKITHTKNRCFEKHNDDIYGWVNSYGDMNLGSHKPEFQGDDWVAVYLHPASSKNQEIKILKLIANRAKCFPNYPIGYHIQEIFAYFGEEQPNSVIAESNSQEQEPVAHFVFSGNVWSQVADEYKHEHFSVPLYTHPAPSWQGLSEEEFIYFTSFVTADVLSEIERTFMEKNHA